MSFDLTPVHFLILELTPMYVHAHDPMTAVFYFMWFWFQENSTALRLNPFSTAVPFWGQNT